MVEVYPSNLTAFPTNTPSELHVFRHNSDTLGVKRAQVGILEKRDQVSLRRLGKQHGFYTRVVENYLPLATRESQSTGSVDPT